MLTLYRKTHNYFDGSWKKNKMKYDWMSLDESEIIHPTIFKGKSFIRGSIDWIITFDIRGNFIRYSEMLWIILNGTLYCSQIKYSQCDLPNHLSISEALAGHNVRHKKMVRETFFIYLLLRSLCYQIHHSLCWKIKVWHMQDILYCQ